MLLSLLARFLPGMDVMTRRQSERNEPPGDKFDRRQVEEWRTRGQSPAGALAQPTAPGPEGLAEQFAFKIASGVFGRDLSPHARAAGIGTHLLYGSAWGAL